VSDNSNLASWFSLANKLLAVGYDVAASAAPEIARNDDHAGDIRLMAVSLIARSLSNLRATLAMVNAKRLVEARVIARCILENQFWLVGFANDPDRFRQIIIDDDLNRRGLKGRTLFETGEMPDEVEKGLRQWMRDNKSWKTSKSITPKQLARDAQVGDAYVFYDYLSSDAHPTVSALNRYVVSTDGKEISGIDLDPEPSEEELVETTGLGCFGLVNVLVGGCTILKSDAAQEVDELAREYLRLMATTAKAREVGPDLDSRTR
jgi:hypothetical protein